MFGEMLQSGRVASEAKRQEYLDIIVSESERLSALIENVLDFARVERGRQAYDFAEGDVGEAVSKAASVYRYRAEREGVELTVDIAPSLPRASIDERAIQLAVINLIDNALKYAPGSAIAVTARPSSDGRGVIVRVSDHGPGVLPEDQARIFERFVRGASARDPGTGHPVRGSGIGLALVKHIAESHGGRAWVESTSRPRAEPRPSFRAGDSARPGPPPGLDPRIPAGIEGGGPPENHKGGALENHKGGAPENKQNCGSSFAFAIGSLAH
jgi:two-component system phosphate regulon sensor histidine kinase PhoR